MKSRGGRRRPNFQSLNRYYSAKYRVWSRENRYIADVQGQTVKGQGHSFTDFKLSENYPSVDCWVQQVTYVQGHYV